MRAGVGRPGGGLVGSVWGGAWVERRIWVDGRLVPWGDATLHLLAHSVARGSLVFDYMSVHETPRGPAVFRLGRPRRSAS